ncbi:DUF4178 domain-containing protein [Chitinibacter bivalviorum]|uniref:DUF4178 domain-containing protein n=1 Tax=Chitinibacter bivalviorum TaxID=2739434 RepID=A0A7H9BHD5_9NEIS|nr:DUF4178 domain-containing protein [Chitinibacter bivalviorum]QLG88143.1 DUF4178 domain-containing protein [Chitinibacter bivalviorum]
MFRTACPSCGAEVLFRSTISAIAVCEYCQSTVLRSADEVKDIGKIGKVLEDYSPIQIGTSGVFAGRAFTVIGRIQLRYDAGLWNEWYVSFDDGKYGWLGDTCGQYMFTLSLGDAANPPAFDDLSPEMRYEHGGRAFVVTDKRTAQCVGGQGELPFVVGNGYVAKVVDCRNADRFLTLDYSDVSESKPHPALYVGEAVELKALQAHTLRSDEEIQRSAGRLKGTANVLDCPSCGNQLQYQAGVATQIVCKACGSEVDCSGDRALVLTKHTEAERYHATLDVGDSATIAEGDKERTGHGVKWTVIGLIEMAEIEDPDSHWTEYLLYSWNRGFFWLVEAKDGWYRVEVLNQLPESWSDGHAVLAGQRYNKLYDSYHAKVIYAAGAFNWRVSVGDRVQLWEYAQGDSRLSREKNTAEVVWSKSSKVSNAQIGQWFGKLDVQTIQSDTVDGELTRSTAWRYTLILLVLNLPLWFAGDWDNVIWTAIAAYLLHWPLNKSAEADE